MCLQSDANNTANKTHAINTQLICTTALSEQSSAARCPFSFIHLFHGSHSLGHLPDFPLLWPKEATQMITVAEVTTRESHPTIPPLFIFPPQYLFGGRKKVFSQDLQSTKP